MAEIPAQTGEKIVPRIIEEEMKTSYLDYSMSVIVGRALPDVRDGLKPVHRRVLYAMYELGMLHNKPFKKSARIVGEVLGKYHPHGDSPVYFSMVRMAQDFAVRYPLIEGQGNFGCFTKDTKVRLADGRALTFGEIVEEQKKGVRNFTFTVKKDGNIGIAEIKSPRMTKKGAGIIKVILDNGEEIKCTPDHRFMLLDGSYCQAKDLTSGTSLMQNHKVVHVVSMNDLADVYDLTIEDTHNFLLAAGVFVHNSIDGDNPAAMRYTESRLSKISEELLTDIEKETVAFVPNFDNSLEEPVVLPSKIPNLLLNGSTGIAVGMATNIPPHNLREICSGIIAWIDNADIDINDLIKHIPAPDFPTGGIICGTKGIREAYATGRGRIVLRARHHFEETKNKTSIIITEIPYQVSKAELLEQIFLLHRDKKLVGITDLRDESDREGLRIVIELKSGVNREVLLNQLFSHTRLQETYGIINLALVDNQPRVLGLKEMIAEFVKHRQDVVRKGTIYDLAQAEKRAHLLEGLIVALAHIDEIIAFLKRTKSTELARQGLMQDYMFSEQQATAVLEMKLSKLTNLEQESIREEHKDLLIQIADLKDILASETRIFTIIKNELSDLSVRFGDARRTMIQQEGIQVIEEEALIKPEDVVVTISHTGYLKRLPLDTYKSQKRGGKGIIAAETKEEDYIEHLFAANTHDHLLFFTNLGKVHWLKVYHVPEAGRYARGGSIANILNLSAEERVTSYLPIKEFTPDKYILFVTKKGIVKKTSLDLYSNPRNGGILAMGLDEGDELIRTLITDGKTHVILATQEGLAIRFDETDVRPMGRAAGGVIGIKLKEDDRVIDAVVADETKTLMTVTEHGFGKRTPIADYRIIGRGGVGVINIKITDKNGRVVAVQSVQDDNEIMIITKNNVMIRMRIKDISIVGRNTQGVHVMRLDEKDKVVACTTVVQEE